jgi:phosphatidylserine/phosphatidylglycerophosphate/cardiolipin synthase-like enzyme
MRQSRRNALALTLAAALLTTACSRSTVTAPELGAQRGESAAVVASAGNAALADLRLGDAGPLTRQASGMEPAAFAAADANRDGSLSATEQAAVFWQVWKAMTAVAPADAPAVPAKGDDGDVQNTAAYSVPHSLQLTPTDAELFIDAAEILPAVYQTIQGAKKSIHMDLFLLGGAEGRKLAEVLVAKAKEGVDVKLIHDPGYGLSGVAREQIIPVIAYLQSQGIAIKSFPIKLLERRKGHPFANKFQIDHNKFFIVDGTTAMIGTMNLIDVGVMNHDVFVRFTGGAAAELQAIHEATWKLKGPKVPDFRRVEVPKRTVQQAASGAMARIVKTDIDQQTTKRVLLENIKAAKKSVHLAIFEFGDMDVTAALIEAYKRGVDVKVLADKNANYAKYLDAFKNFKLYGTPNLATMNRLRDAGVPVKWYVPKTDDQELHMKVAMFDGDRAIVGSTNFTYQAFKTFRETSIEVVGGTVAPRLESMFQRDWETSAAPVTAPTFFEKCVISAVKAMDKLNLSWW